MEAFLFYSLSSLSVLSALAVILCRNPTKALLSLVVTMVALSGIYLTLGAYFISIAQIIVYAGAVLVVFLFVIMLQGVGAKDVPLFRRAPIMLTISCFATASVFFVFFSIVVRGTEFSTLHQARGSLEAVGRVLFTHFLLPFELTAVLLLICVFAAVALAKQEKEA